MILVTLTVGLLTISRIYPSILSDHNEFLEGFFDTDFLSVLGFMISISLASAVNIHFRLIDYIEKSGIPLNGTLAKVRASSLSLVVIFILAFALVILKPVFACNPFWEGVFNSLGIVILYFNVSVMNDLMQTALAIPPFPKSKK